MIAKRRRYRPTIAPRPQLRPSVDPNVFDWVPGERVDSVRKPKRDTGVLARCKALYGRQPEGGTE
jgi:hypothetical protein